LSIDFQHFNEGGEKVILENIRRLCKERNLTIAELEREAKLGNGVIARWGEMNPRVDKLKAVADVFGVTVDDLISSSTPTA
jgi:transcriptional regulator with XRE-family HTH domain